MMKQCIFTIVLLSALAVAGQPHGTGQAGRHIVLDLWPGGVPADNGVDYQAPANPNDVKPQLHVFLPSGHSDASRAVIICPGGAYAGLAMQHEGFEWKDFFTSRNIAALVLLYRLPHGHHQVPADDLLQAMRLTRQHAALWHIDPGQIGVMGSSAGGHLATTVATHAPASLTPAFQILFYPVVSTDSLVTHQWSCHNLLGRSPSPELLHYYSNERHVTPSAPAAFIAASADDVDVPVLNSARYFEALTRNGVPAVIHIYPTGGQGWGIKQDFRYHRAMLQDLSDWLEALTGR